MTTIHDLPIDPALKALIIHVHAAGWKCGAGNFESTDDDFDRATEMATEISERLAK